MSIPGEYQKSIPLAYKVVITDQYSGKLFALKDVVADGYIPDRDIRFFVTDKGVRYEMRMSRGVIVKFAKEREQIIDAKEKKNRVNEI